MMGRLATFAALSMVGTVLLSLLPEGGIKRTAGMAVGLLTLMCWAEGIGALLGIELALSPPSTALVPTSVTVESASAQAAEALYSAGEDTP